MKRARRPFLGLLRYRIGVALLAVIALTSVGAAWVLFMKLLASDADVNAIVRENAVWAIFQTDKHLNELYRVGEVILATQDASRHQDLITSYDILYSRVTLLQRGTILLELSGEAQIQRAADTLRTAVLALADQVDQLDPAHPSYFDHVAELTSEVAPLLRVSSQALLDTNDILSAMRVADRENRFRMQEYLAWLALLLVLAFLGIFALLIRQVWQMSRANQMMALLQKRARHKAQRALAASKAKSTFLATMSHEIRTPLNGIIGSAELLSFGSLSERDAQQLGAIQTSANLLRDLIDGILDFSRLDAGIIEQHATETNLADLAETIERAFRLQSDRSGVDLNVSLPKVRVTVNDRRLKQVLVNLVGNALKFTQQGGVRVSGVLLNDTRLRIEVEDDGIGIGAEDLPKLFRDFSQVDGSHGRRFGGSGLGLAISRRIVEGLGGEIGVRSTLGAGSLFWFELPVGQASETGPLDTGVSKTPRQASKASLDVLVVEDNDINLAVIQSMLLHLGHRVSAARDGEEAVAILSDICPDIVLMDMQMPRMDGLEATRRLRAMGQRVPIIGVTANAFEQDRRACLAAGMDDFLPKPVTTAGLAEALGRFRQDADAGPAENDGNSILDPIAQFDDTGVHLADNEQLRGLAEALGRDVLVQLMDRFAVEIETLHADLATLLPDANAEAQDGLLHSFKGAALTLGLQASGDLAQRLRETLPVREDEVLRLVSTAWRDLESARTLLADAVCPAG